MNILEIKLNNFRAEHMLNEFECIPYYYPTPTKEFFQKYIEDAPANISLFCNIEQLVRMSKHVDKFSATGSPEKMIKGKIAEKSILKSNSLI